MWTGIKIEGNVRIYKKIVLHWYEKQLKKTIYLLIWFLQILLYIDKLKGKFAQYKCVSCYSANVQKQPSIVVPQKRCSTKTEQIYWRSPIKLYSKNSSINLNFWECRLVWMVLTLFRMGFFGAAHEWGRAFCPPPLPKTGHTYPTMMKLGTVIP